MGKRLTPQERAERDYQTALMATARAMELYGPLSPKYQTIVAYAREARGTWLATQTVEQPCLWSED